MDYEKKYNEAMKREEAIRRIKAWNLDADDLEVLSILIPELRKSKEEKIRQFLIERMISLYGADSVTPDGIAVNDIVSYLEKQKEQKPEIKYVYPKFRKGDVIEPITPNGHFTPVRVVDIWDGSYSCRSDDDKAYLSLPIKREDEYRLVEPKHAPDDLQKSFEAGQMSIVDNPEQYGLCKKAEWSEEDDRVFEFAIARVEIYERDFLHGNNEMSERLKSLRPSWKPSEEQMLVLGRFLKFLHESGSPDFGLMDSLIGELKTL